MTVTRRAMLTGMACAAAAGLAPAAMALPGRGGAKALIAAARRQVGVTLHYDPAYSRIPFPNGDVPRVKGVCTDVLIRAYRDAFALDLQVLLNADMRMHFAAYPRNWGLRSADRNIDHRRVPNLATYFRRRGAALPVPAEAGDWQPGDIFTSLIGGRLPHTGIVSDRRGPNGWLVIHNIGAGAREEDALSAHPLTGRFRWGIA